MMRFRNMALGAAALGCCGAAIAQEQTINDYVISLIEDIAEEGTETLVEDIGLTELYAGDSDEFAFDLEPDKSYTVYGACDDDCADIDLVAYNSDGDIVASDEVEDDLPILNIAPGDSGDSIHIEIVMVECETDVCVAGVGLYERDE